MVRVKLRISDESCRLATKWLKNAMRKNKRRKNTCFADLTIPFSATLLARLRNRVATLSTTVEVAEDHHSVVAGEGGEVSAVADPPSAEVVEAAAITMVKIQQIVFEECSM